MQNKTFYDQTGKIISSVSADNLAIVDLSQWSQYQSIDAKADILFDWVENGIVKPRPENPATLNGLIISRIPSGSVLRIEDAEYPITDTEVELDLPPNRSTVVLRCFPYLDKTFEVA